jgi:hypothetical protein
MTKGRPSTTKHQKEPAPPKKRDWHPPTIKTGQLFESNSLSCGKSNMMMEPCLQNPQNS